MIDGEGRVRITDFGLAGREGEGTGQIAGTLAYMAPEQFEGKPATVRSDLYSLGLVLYEIYTGRRALEAASFAEWRSKHTETTPPSPSTLAHDIDDAADRAILRCERARQIVAQLGYGSDLRDSDAWFIRDYGPLRFMADHQPSRQWRAQMGLSGPPVSLLYRQSLKRMVPGNELGRVDVNDPPFELSGSVVATTDAVGRLVYLRVMPPQRDTGSAVARPVDWDALFGPAGLDRSKFSEVASQWIPPVAFDQRAEWTGVAPWAPDTPVRVSAAAWQGRPVYFEVLGPWAVADGRGAPESHARHRHSEPEPGPCGADRGPHFLRPTQHPPRVG
jgi:serine/threonine protein kinase